MNIEELVEKAIEARANAYTPYSNYNVGVALLTKNDKVYTGCNIENDGVVSMCAERVAFFKAISEGERDFKCMVVVGGKKGDNLELTTPCGYCRQFMSEFVDKYFKVYLYYGDIKQMKVYSLEQLLPDNFNLENK